MDQPPLLIRNVSDTAHWAAYFRAQEAERSDALFRDPYAARLAGERGARMARAMGGNSWAWVARTWLFDELIRRMVGEGVDVVVNLAAGLDARPYRMALPPALHWVEVDLPDILAEKEGLLGGEKSACSLERVRLDLAQVEARRELFSRIGSRARRALVLCEGLLIYLTADEVALLARDLAAVRTFQGWILDLASPGLLRMVQRRYAPHVHARSPLQFGPAEGPLFFGPHGWRPAEVHSFLRTAARLGRLSLFMRLLALLPESSGRQGGRPWGGVCRFERNSSHVVA